jgi:hypothetical protein
MPRSEQELEKIESATGDQKSITVSAIGKAEGADIFKHMMGGTKTADSRSVCEKRGDRAVTVDANGQIESVTMPNGTIMRREKDGNWNAISTDGIEEGPVFKNVKVEKDGTVSYDRNDKHIVINNDGSGSHEIMGGAGKVSFDKNGRITEAPAGDGRTRKFHYNEKGELDQIDGNLGHWDRQVGKDGKSEWVNRDSGDVWKGEFDINPDNGDVWYTTPDGTQHTFTADGKDIRN